MFVLRMNGVQHQVGTEQEIRIALADLIKEARAAGAVVEPDEDETRFQFTKVVVSLPGCYEPDILEIDVAQEPIHIHDPDAVNWNHLYALTQERST